MKKTAVHYDALFAASPVRDKTRCFTVHHFRMKFAGGKQIYMYRAAPVASFKWKLFMRKTGWRESWQDAERRLRQRGGHAVFRGSFCANKPPRACCYARQQKKNTHATTAHHTDGPSSAGSVSSP